MINEKELKYIEGAVDNINNAIAMIRTIKDALGMLENSHIEKELKAARDRLETAMQCCK